MSTSDMLLLDNIMNSIWHKFKIMRVIVAFPYTCEDKMLIYNGKRPSTDGDCLYDRPVKLINATNKQELLKAIRKSGEKLSENYPIKASIFERYPTSIKDCSNLHYYGHFNLSRSHGYCGLDGIVMNDLITHFNFNLSFPENETCNTYGFAVPGNLSGSLGCIARNELDISFNSRFMTLYSDEHIYYLHYVITDKLCAFVKRTGVIPIWHGAFNVYSPPSWMFIIGVIMLISVIIWCSAIVNKRLTGVKNKSCWYYLYHTLTMTMTGSSPMKQRTLLLMRGSCLAGSVLFLAVYQGHISRVYTTLRRIEQISTLEELYRSGATLYTSPSFRELSKQLLNKKNKLQVEFFNRSLLTPHETLGADLVLQQPFATSLERKSDAEMEILTKYSNEQGPLIDMVAECLHNYYLSYIARSGFPFFEDLQVFAARLKEAGLPEAYYRWTQKMLNIPTSMPEDHSIPRCFRPIRLRDQRVPFGVLFVGTILSLIVFAAEIRKGKGRNVK
ncbi:uncharacterized protein LOC110382022 [Helicoverpa armigera]|uniref:uncharacterized protein LOC110382022 n=1 Tax=Helicoverpa armigera TaxID=29058 RepID=UPI0030834A3A